MGAARLVLHVSARHQPAGETIETWLERPPVTLLAVERSGVCSLLEGKAALVGLGGVRVGDDLVASDLPHGFVSALERALAGEVVATVLSNEQGRSELRLFPRRGGGVDGVAVPVPEGHEPRNGFAYDELTGLAGRRLFLDRLRVALARVARKGGRVAVIALDIDRFTFVNEIWGHAVGDLLLAELGVQLTAGLRAGDTVARTGGDQFALVCEDVVTDHALLSLAERIKDAVETPVAAGRQHIFLSASMGIALTSSEPTSPEDLLIAAETAMAEASRRHGGGRWEIYDPAVRVRARRHREIEQGLRLALERGQFRLQYQPIVDLRSDACTGVEALLRWHHPERGLIPPMEFIPLAEETGLIGRIGAWVLGEAASAAQSWADEGLSVAVNVSPAQLTDDLSIAIADLDGGARRLCLELTESALADDAERTAATLRRLKAFGVSLAIDDFGTGYSSLSHLKLLPIDALKLDRSFVAGLGSDPGDLAIAEAAIGLAHSFGITAIAEGVEEPGQLELLRQLGCDEAQGYLFARPMDPADVARWLHNRPVGR